MPGLPRSPKNCVPDERGAPRTPSDRTPSETTIVWLSGPNAAGTNEVARPYCPLDITGDASSTDTWDPGWRLPDGQADGLVKRLGKNATELEFGPTCDHQNSWCGLIKIMILLITTP